MYYGRIRKDKNDGSPSTKIILILSYKVYETHVEQGINDLELTVRALNINKGRNEAVVNRSKTLNDYVFWSCTKRVKYDIIFIKQKTRVIHTLKIRA